MAFTQYVGNPDFRGYLSYLGQNGNTFANNALSFTGNDGGIDNTALKSYYSIDNPAAPGYQTQQQDLASAPTNVASLYNAYQGLNTGNDSPTGTSYTGSTSTAPTVNNQPYIDQINNQINRLPGQLDIAKSNLQGQFSTNQNQINSGEQQAQQQYNQATDQNHGQYVTNKNGIQNQASAGLHGLLRLLGMHGAGGSSDYLQAAPQAVAQQATQQRAGAGQAFGQNQQGLDSNWNNYETGVGTAKQKLNDWLSTQLNSAQSQSDQTHQGLLEKLAGLQPTVAATQPYLDQINGLQDQVDQLGKLNPTYNGVTPTYTAPSVASYTVNPTAAPKLASNALDNVTSPYLGMLLGNLKDKNQQQPSF